MFFGFDFSSSFCEMTQSWFLSKYLKMDLRFFGVLFKNWLEMWYSENLMFSSLLMSKASKNLAEISPLGIAAMFLSWERVLTSPTHFSILFKTENYKKCTKFGSKILSEVIDVYSSSEFSEGSVDFLSIIVVTWSKGLDLFGVNNSVVVKIHQSDERFVEVFIT